MITTHKVARCKLKLLGFTCGFANPSKDVLSYQSVSTLSFERAVEGMLLGTRAIANLVNARTYSISLAPSTKQA